MSAAEQEVLQRIRTPIGGVMPDMAAAVWPKIEPLLDRVVTPDSGFSTAAILEGVKSGTMQLWVIGDFQAVVVSYIQVRPLHKVLWMQFIAGEEMREWLEDWIVFIEGFARHHDCEAIEFSGRKGWLRRLKSHPEYRPVMTIFRREL